MSKDAIIKKYNLTPEDARILAQNERDCEHIPATLGKLGLTWKQFEEIPENPQEDPAPVQFWLGSAIHAFVALLSINPDRLFTAKELQAIGGARINRNKTQSYICQLAEEHFLKRIHKGANTYYTIHPDMVAYFTQK